MPPSVGKKWCLTIVSDWMPAVRRYLLAACAMAGVLSLIGIAPALAQGDDRGEPLDPAVTSLGIVGYNYTNRSIDSFTVNGAGGGNLFISSPTSGGGGTSCCVPYVPGVSHKRATIRWQIGGCKYHTRSTDSSDVYEHIHHVFREVELEVEKPFPAYPRYLEVHFYPDGSVQAVLAEQESPPLLKLPASREDKSSYPPCPEDKRPTD